jgi:hypothetical protein
LGPRGQAREDENSRHGISRKMYEEQKDSEKKGEQIEEK